MTTEAVKSKYSDPSNTKDILEELKEAHTIGDVNTVINRTFPDWQVAALQGFCSGYPHLNFNWGVLCEKIKVKPAQIIVVRELEFDNNHIVLRSFVECLVRAGFAVKRMVDYVPCNKCGMIAVPTPQIHNLMEEKGIAVPDKNLPMCMGCR